GRRKDVKGPIAVPLALRRHREQISTQMFKRRFGIVFVQILRPYAENFLDRLNIGRDCGEYGGRLFCDATKKLAMRIGIKRRVEKQKRQPQPSMRLRVSR